MKLLACNFSKSNTHPWVFSRFLNCTSDTESRKAAHLLLRYFDSSDDIVTLRFYDSRFLGHGIHSNLMQQFNDATKGLNPNHMYQISMDDSNVILKFYDCIV